jgi:hypothetical protein
VEICEIREEARERVRFVHVRIRRSIVQQCDREVEVGKWDRCESFHQDVNDNIRIIQIGIELISKKRRLNIALVQKKKKKANSFKIARFARQSYSRLRIW